MNLVQLVHGRGRLYLGRFEPLCLALFPLSLNVASSHTASHPTNSDPSTLPETIRQHQRPHNAFSNPRTEQRCALDNPRGRPCSAHRRPHSLCTTSR